MVYGNNQWWFVSQRLCILEQHLTRWVFYSSVRYALKALSRISGSYLNNKYPISASGMEHKASQGVHTVVKQGHNVWYFVLLQECRIYLDIKSFFWSFSTGSSGVLPAHLARGVIIPILFNSPLWPIFICSSPC